MAKASPKPATESLAPQPISGNDEMAAQAVMVLDGFVSDFCKQLAERGQSTTAQVINQTAFEAKRIARERRLAVEMAKCAGAEVQP